MAAHRDVIESLALNDAGDLLASGGFREIKLWRRPSDVQLAVAQLPGPANSLAVSPDRTLIACGHEGELAITIWNAKAGEPILKLNGHTQEVTGLVFTADGKQLISSSLDGSIRSWDVASGVEMGRFDTPSPVSAVAVAVGGKSSDGQATSPILVTAGEDKLLRTWRLPTAPTALPKAPIDAPGEVLDDSIAAELSRDARLLALIAGDELQILQRDEQGAPWKSAATKVIDDGRPTCQALLDPPLEKEEAERRPPFLLTANGEGMLSLWSLPSCERLGRWRIASQSIRSLAVSREGAVIAAGEEGGGLTLWTLDSSADRLSSETDAAAARTRSIHHGDRVPRRRPPAVGGGRRRRTAGLRLAGRPTGVLIRSSSADFAIGDITRPAASGHRWRGCQGSVMAEQWRRIQQGNLGESHSGGCERVLFERREASLRGLSGPRRPCARL